MPVAKRMVCNTYVGTYPMGNNVDISRSIGKMLNGTYTFKDTSAPYRHGAKGGDTKNGAYGTNGIFRLNDFVGRDKKIHTDVGVHAGEADVKDTRGGKGPQHCTYGCSRTDEAGMGAITDLAKKDPLTTYTVINNENHSNSGNQKGPTAIPSANLQNN